MPVIASPTPTTSVPWACDQSRNRTRRFGLSAAEFLGRHDSYAFFQVTGDLLITGLTQTNVMDARVLLVLPL